MSSDLARAFEIPAEALRVSSDALGLAFDRTDRIREDGAGPAQERAIDAIRFGLEITRDGHNVFVLGRHGSRRHSLALELAKDAALKRKAPGDWCYVNNFSDPERPRTLHFPAGQGGRFRTAMRDLIEELRLVIPAVFESEDYRAQLKSIEAATQKELEAQWEAFEARARQEGIGLLQTPTGYVLAPIRDGEVVDEEAFSKLPEKERETIQATIQRLSEELQAQIERMPLLRKRHRQQVRTLNREVTEQAVRALIADLKKQYGGLPEVGEYLDDVQANIVEHSKDFHEQETPALPFLARNSSGQFGQYEVNLVVSQDADAPAPVVFEANPTYNNIIGKIEHRSEMGALVTDFRLIRAGALLEANGGYLVLDMHRVLGRPFIWESLKQALFAGQVRIESPGESWGIVSTTTLRPEPIPLDVKVILIGERYLYYLLCQYDSEFTDLFKVAADLDDELVRDKSSVTAFVHLVAERIREHDLLPFTRDAVMRVIDQRARRAEDSERLSMHMRSLEDLLLQSDHWARHRGADTVDAEDVGKAIREAARRLGRAKSRIIDAITRDTLLIDTAGTSVGQVNGLAVVDFGEFSFGHPMRITATSRMGSGKVVDIEREVELGGAIHSKGVLILSALLSSRYARQVPLALQANIVFEQSYGDVEGDSASIAELCALLSSISGIPIIQGIAVTGSVNQQGRMQAVGGINDKVEGFFDVCAARGLDGSHAVVIPRDNVKHLMLRDDVVDAVRGGRFRVYSATDIDEAITILTGVDAGERGPDGAFPDGSVNARVEAQLVQFAMDRKAFDKEDEEASGDDSKDDEAGTSESDDDRK